MTGTMSRAKPHTTKSPVGIEKRCTCSSGRKSRTRSPREAHFHTASRHSSRRDANQSLCLTALPIEILEEILFPLDCLSLTACHAASSILAAVISSPCFLDKVATTKLHCPGIALRDLPELSPFQQLWHLTYCAVNNPHMSLVLTRKRPTGCAPNGDCNNDALYGGRPRDSPLASRRTALVNRSGGKTAADVVDDSEGEASQRKAKESAKESNVSIQEACHSGTSGITRCASTQDPETTARRNKCCVPQVGQPLAQSSRRYRLEDNREELDDEDKDLYVTYSECTCTKFTMGASHGTHGITLCGRHAALHIGSMVHSLVGFFITAGCFPGRCHTNYPEPFFSHLPPMIQDKPQALASLVRFALAFPELLEVGQRSKIARLSVHAGGPREFDAVVESGWQQENGSPALTLELVLLSTPPGSVWLVLALAVYVAQSGGLSVWTGALNYVTFGTRQTFSAHGFPPCLAPALMRQELASTVLIVLEASPGESLPVDVTNRYVQRSLEMPIFSSKTFLITALVSHLKSTVKKMEHLCHSRLEFHEIKALPNFLSSLIPSGKPLIADCDESYDDEEEDEWEDGSRALGGRGKGKKREGNGECPGRNGVNQDRPEGKVFAAIYGCLRRVMNRIFLEEVRWYMGDSLCRRYLCKHGNGEASPSTEDGGASSWLNISVHRLPLKIWPPHLLCQAGHVVPALARVLELDIVLWLQSLHTASLPEGAHLAFRKSLRHSGLTPAERDPNKWRPPLVPLLRLQA